MTQANLLGSCLCGTVRYEIAPPFLGMVHCHCSRCRKGTGTGHATNLYTAPGQLKFLAGEENIARYDLPTAKSFGKWFCKTCGGPVPRLTRNKTRIVVPAGTLDSLPQLKPTDHIFWGSRAPWGCGSSDLPTHAEYPEGF